MEEALQLFALHGFAGTSVRQLASAAGITEGALYAHFSGKHAIFEQLFREAGPAAVTSAILQPNTVAHDEDPPTFVRAVIDAVLSQWSEPRARRFTAVVLRECTVAARNGAPSLNEGIAEALKQVGRIFESWMARGLMRDDFPPEHLAWELFAPLINLRVMYLHPNATQAEIASAKAAGQRHADYFLSCALKHATAKER